MAGSASITGRQHYVLGIGHPVTEAETEAPPAVYSLDDSGNVTGLVGPDGDPINVPVNAAEMIDSSDAFRSSAALFVTTPLQITATQVARKVRINWQDLAPVSGWTTDATGYAVGSKTINTPAGAVGAIYRGDTIRIGAGADTYQTTSIDTDLSNASSVTLAGYGVAVAVPAALTALSVLSRGQKIYGAINCDNSVEASVACQDPRQRDFELVLGGSIVITSSDPISNIWITSAVDGVPINLHRIETFFGA